MHHIISGKITQHHLHAFHACFWETLENPAQSSSSNFSGSASCLIHSHTLPLVPQYRKALLSKPSGSGPSLLHSTSNHTRLELGVHSQTILQSQLLLGNHMKPSIEHHALSSSNSKSNFKDHRVILTHEFLIRYTWNRA